jgi:hypothetical protein
MTSTAAMIAVVTFNPKPAPICGFLRAHGNPRLSARSNDGKGDDEPPRPA